MLAATPDAEPEQARLPTAHCYMEEGAQSAYYDALRQRDDRLKRLADLVRDVAQEEDLCGVLDIAVTENPWAGEDPRGPALDEHIWNIAEEEDFPEQFLLRVLGTEGLIEAAKKVGFARWHHRRLSLNPVELARAVAEVLGFPPLRQPYGLMRMIEDLEAVKGRLANQLRQGTPDVVVVRGCIVTAFRLLEGVLRELLDFCLQWRFGGDESQLGIWLTDKRHLDTWRQGRVTLGTYRTILVNIEQVLQSQPDEARRLEEWFGRSYFINPPEGTKLQPLLGLPDVTRDHLKEIMVSIDRRNAVIHWTERESERQADLLEAVEKVYDFLNYLAIGQIFPEVVTVLEQGNHYRAGARVRIRNERGEDVSILWKEPLELHPTEYYFAQANQRIFIKRRRTYDETQ